MTASTLLGTVRTTIVGGSLVGGRVFHDLAPEGANLPYVTLTDPILVPVLTGDGTTVRRERTIQVHLWQNASAKSQVDVMATALVNLLDGAVVTVGVEKVRLRVQSVQRLVDPDGETVHHVLTVIAAHGRSVN